MVEKFFRNLNTLNARVWAIESFSATLIPAEKLSLRKNFSQPPGCPSILSIGTLQKKSKKIRIIIIFVLYL